MFANKIVKIYNFSCEKFIVKPMCKRQKVYNENFQKWGVVSMREGTTNKQKQKKGVRIFTWVQNKKQNKKKAKEEKKSVFDNQ